MPPDLFAHYIRQELPLLKAHARAYIKGDHAAADDLVQDTVLRAWCGRNDLRDRARFRPWLHTILRNMARSHGRRLTPVQYLSNPPEIADLNADPALRFEYWDAICNIAVLPEEQREALYRVVGEGESYASAASLCAVPVATLKSRLARARRTLRAN